MTDQRDAFACAALSALLPHATFAQQIPQKVLTAQGRGGSAGHVVGMDDGLADWACDMAYKVADRMILARTSSLPRQVARLKAEHDAAEAAASPAAPLLAGPGAA